MTYRDSTTELRVIAIDFALRGGNVDRSDKDVVARAETFYKFMAASEFAQAAAQGEPKQAEAAS